MSFSMSFKIPPEIDLFFCTVKHYLFILCRTFISTIKWDLQFWVKYSRPTVHDLPPILFPASISITKEKHFYSVSFIHENIRINVTKKINFKV